VIRCAPGLSPLQVKALDRPYNPGAPNALALTWLNTADNGNTTPVSTATQPQLSLGRQVPERLSAGEQAIYRDL
jgi:hypothetical protein